jgi:hypothetical protein
MMGEVGYRASLDGTARKVCIKIPATFFAKLVFPRIPQIAYEALQRFQQAFPEERGLLTQTLESMATTGVVK